MATIRFPYEGVKPMEIPERNLMGVFSPPRMSPGRTEEEILSDALANPVAAATLFLLSSDAAFITGADLPVDGGYQGLGSEGLGSASQFAGSH
jgi:NAD(P)-dependent dehydrogenase (short-subunit alcohol dehydrogenase family)